MKTRAQITLYDIQMQMRQALLLVEDPLLVIV